MLLGGYIENDILLNIFYYQHDNKRQMLSIFWISIGYYYGYKI